MILSNSQIEFIRDFLKERAVTHEGLSEELLDHIATKIEQQMEAGAIFQGAAASTFESFQKDEMQEIQSQILLIQNRFFMTRRTLKYILVVSISITIIGFLIDSDEPVGDIYFQIYEGIMFNLLIFVILCVITGIGILTTRSFSKLVVFIKRNFSK